MSFFFVDLTIILIKVDAGGEEVLWDEDGSNDCGGDHDCLLRDGKQQWKTYAISYCLPMNAFLKSQKILICFWISEFQKSLYIFYINFSYWIKQLFS